MFWKSKKRQKIVPQESQPEKIALAKNPRILQIYTYFILESKLEKIWEI
jgi:hypothetical protein